MIGVSLPLAKSGKEFIRAVWLLKQALGRAIANESV